jgi:ribosome biogenesis GTPase
VRRDAGAQPRRTPILLQAVSGPPRPVSVRRAPHADGGGAVGPPGEVGIGRVVAHYGVEVVVREADGSRRRVAVPRRSSLVVGDRVRLDAGSVERLPAEGVLRRRDRRGRVRSVAANLDAVGIVLAPRPRTPAAFVDRAIVGARAAGIAPFFVVNKADLPGAERLAARARVDWPGVEPVCVVSAESGKGLDSIRAHLAGGLRAVFVGVSGVGKSSLVNALVDEADLAVGEINETSGLGRHVTTNATLYALPDGGELIDTPGFRDFGPVAVSATELARFFPGFEAAAAEGCRYRDCRHRSEPGCAVLEAVDAGAIDPDRHAAYGELRDELERVEREARGY